MAKKLTTVNPKAKFGIERTDDMVFAEPKDMVVGRVYWILDMMNSGHIVAKDVIRARYSGEDYKRLTRNENFNYKDESDFHWNAYRNVIKELLRLKLILIKK